MDKLSRRGLLSSARLAAVGWAADGRTALADVALNPAGKETARDILVTVFMRGGADGLNIIVPYAEDAYHRRRPNLRIPGPNDRTAAAAARAIDLDGFFGMNPAMAPLVPHWQNGIVSFVHAIGSADQTRSHFEAMLTMERGQPNDTTGAASGWLARHLSTSEPVKSSPLRAVAFSSTMPDILRGATDATALNSLNDYRLIVDGGEKRESELRSVLAEFYADGNDAAAVAGRETLAVLDTLNRVNPASYKPANGAVYPASDLGTGLRQVACLVRGDVGLEVACLDHRGPYSWDTHVTQNPFFGQQLGDLVSAVAAFLQDMGTEMARITLVVFTEFGRRLQEGSSLGTDHGRGSCMMLMGRNIVAGKVFRRWPGLEETQLEPPGDLRVTTDYRDVLAEIVQKRLHNNRLSEVFPDYAPQTLGVVKT